MHRNFRDTRFYFGMPALISGIVLICLYDSGIYPFKGTNKPLPPITNDSYCDDILIENSHHNIISGDGLIICAQIVAVIRMIYQQV